MDDVETLTELNERFIEAFRHGSWEMLEPILAPSFRYLNGLTGESMDIETYRKGLDGDPTPTLTIDEVVVHATTDAAIVSARSSREPGRYSRYIDTYEKQEGAWFCIHACVWPLQPVESR